MPILTGTWHPKGDDSDCNDGILAKELGVRFHTDAPVARFLPKQDSNWYLCWGTFHESVIIVSGADYHHTERLLQAS